ncbi:MAG: hypothetical protein KKD07_00740 [Candidatus Omnitrophica bacterium]|nr:hypothetical protein [Candidatus Omnitrophota bacterium]MBU1997243.1 hypothetical protein [Candidatus Omnitrophota bacterium]MBU4332948.1 hypothetical protein [Candidatus Omnitrophota bacterium]
MSDINENKCPTCRESCGDSGHLCMPIEKGDSQCDWCGSVIPNQRHLCDAKVKELSYICNSCGRTAISPENLCKPEKIK